MFSNKALQFNRTSQNIRRKMWWKNTKMTIILVVVVLVIIGTVIGVVVAKYGPKSKSSGTTTLAPLTTIPKLIRALHKNI
jgi:heme/copper-type cytochrome/quinol oxidase subunit 2